MSATGCGTHRALLVVNSMLSRIGAEEVLSDKWRESRASAAACRSTTNRTPCWSEGCKRWRSCSRASVPSSWRPAA